MDAAVGPSDADDDVHAGVLEAVDSNDCAHHVGRLAPKLDGFDHGGFVFGLVALGRTQLLAGRGNSRSERLPRGSLYRRPPPHADGSPEPLLE